MTSIIVWVLLITMNGGYCAESVQITFTTESACVSALDGLDTQHKNTAKCEPAKLNTERKE